MKNEILYELSADEELKYNYDFAQRLASEFQNFYIGKDVLVQENEIIKIIGKSKIDTSKTLMPYQLIVLKELEKYSKIVISAPTSFGKTFIVLEYIKRFKHLYERVVYVVHTKSLKDELINKIETYFSNEYEVVEDIEDFTNDKRCFLIIVSDGQNIYDFDVDIDLLVVDEAYNLGKSQSQSRYFCIMKSYRQLLNKSRKCILIGPFISEVVEENSTDYKIYKTEFSPVAMRILEDDNLSYDSPILCLHEKVIENNEKTIVYFGSKSDIYDFMLNLTGNYKESKYNDEFIEWMENNFPDFWLLPKIMHLGIGLYHSSFPKYINIYNMNQFNNGSFCGLLTTSSILEGVNTSSKNLILYNTTIGSSNNSLTPFQFFNLCGRVGRLGKEIIGNVYNFGDSYLDMYNKKNLPLYIGNDDIQDDYDKFDESESDNEYVNIKNELISQLNQVNIDYELWYSENSFYSSGSKQMLETLNEYLIYRNTLKTDIDSGSLNIINSVNINKNKIINHIYDNFVKKLDFFKYNQTSQFYPNIPLYTLLQRRMDGINFNMKSLCNDGSISRFINEKSIKEKNVYVLELMRLGYDYIPHKFYNCLYLFNEFVIYDNFWNKDEKNNLYNLLFNRVKLYLNEADDDYATIMKILNNLGVIPDLSKKIIVLLKKEEIVEKYTRKYIINFIKNHLNDISLENYEIINLKNLGLI